MLQIAHDFNLPLEAVTQTFAILAKRGVGKTYTAAVMVEEMVKHQLPVVVIDPVGAWWGLRVAADGEGEGLPITIMGGEHGDLPLHESMGARVAELLAEHQFPAVLDLSLMRKAEQGRFITAFAETLYHVNRNALHLVLDEADLFAPQRPIKGQERMLGAFEDIVRRGRLRGLGITMITQRAAVLNKDVLTQVEVLITLRTVAPQDRAATDEWIKVHGTPEQRDQLMSSLPSLPIGTGWIWSPGWLDVFQQVQIRQRETFDSSATPKVGQRVITPTMRDVDVEWLQSALQVETKTDDVKALRQQIARLEKQANQKQIEYVDVPAISDEQAIQLEQQAHALIELGEQILAQLKRIQSPVAPPIRTITPMPSRAPVRMITPIQNMEPETDDDVRLRAGERRILDMLARRYPTALTRAQVGTLAGFTPSGGTFGTYFGVLKRNGLIVESGNGILITDAGLQYLGIDAPPTPQTTDEVLNMWRQALRLGERSILDTLVNCYPQWIGRDALGEMTGYTASGGTFGTYLGVLRRNGLIEVSGNAVRASETLFV